MPKVEDWWVDRLREFDPDLGIIWDQKIERYVVTRKERHGLVRVDVVRDSNGGFLRPHPNLILFGDPEVGFQGILSRDTYKTGKNDWIDSWERKVEKEDLYRKKQSSNYNRDCVKEVFNSSLCKPRIFIKNNPVNEKAKV